MSPDTILSERRDRGVTSVVPLIWSSLTAMLMALIRTKLLFWNSAFSSLSSDQPYSLHLTSPLSTTPSATTLEIHIPLYAYITGRALISFFATFQCHENWLPHAWAGNTALPFAILNSLIEMNSSSTAQLRQIRFLLLTIFQLTWQRAMQTTNTLSLTLPSALSFSRSVGISSVKKKKKKVQGDDIWLHIFISQKLDHNWTKFENICDLFIFAVSPFGK